MIKVSSLMSHMLTFSDVADLVYPFDVCTYFLFLVNIVKNNPSIHDNHGKNSITLFFSSYLCITYGNVCKNTELA